MILLYYALTHLQEQVGAVCGCPQNSVGNAPLPSRRSLPVIQGLIELLALFSNKTNKAAFCRAGHIYFAV